ncbi:Protein of unknown function [Gryllus bimaculatus]|nr:Protein of unknown function [Gryllus bimaculatus]
MYVHVHLSSWIYPKKSDVRNTVFVVKSIWFNSYVKFVFIVNSYLLWAYYLCLLSYCINCGHISTATFDLSPRPSNNRYSFAIRHSHHQHLYLNIQKVYVSENKNIFILKKIHYFVLAFYRWFVTS